MASGTVQCLIRNVCDMHCAVFDKECLLHQLLCNVYAMRTVYDARYRATFDVLEMPLDWPVDVNYHEAKAFCCWKGPDYRLPAEAEEHMLRGPQVRVFAKVLHNMADRGKSFCKSIVQYNNPGKSFQRGSVQHL